MAIERKRTMATISFLIFVTDQLYGKVKHRASALLSSLDTIRMPQVVQFVKQGVLPANLASCSVVSRKVL